MSTLSYLQPSILGIVEGLTEFLPVSSTAHLTITEKLLGLQVDAPEVTAYTAIIQLGRHRRDAALLLQGHRPAARRLGSRAGQRARPAPTTTTSWRGRSSSARSRSAVVGLRAKDVIEGPLRSLWVVAAALILWSAVMWLAESRHAKLPREGGERGEGTVTVKDGLVIGLVQCFSLSRASAGRGPPSPPGCSAASTG